ncbi:MAG: tetratricopeptide repeat protein, partial [Phycisphaerae bacterium]|nr:tetratricopeptide repeat protein [Phycisphaerae bacterium]
LALELNPNDIETLNCLAVDYTRGGQYDIALDAFEQIEKIDPNFEPCYCNRIITYTEMGHYELAEQMFYLAQQINEKCPLCFYNIGNLFFIRRDFKKAVWCWERTASLEPSHPQINYRIAQAYWNLGDKDMARHHFIEELKTNPGDIDVVFDFGIFLLHSGNISAAAEKFNRILETSPDFAPAIFCIGEIELNRQNFPAAERYYRRAMEIDERQAGPRFRLGQMAFAMGNKSEAFNFLCCELELDIDQPEVLTSIGIIMMKLCQVDYATHCFLKVSELDPTNSVNYLNLAKALALRGEDEDSQQFLDYAVELESENLALIKQAAKISLRLGNLQNSALILSQYPEDRRDLSFTMLWLTIRFGLLRDEIKQRFSYLLKRFRRR